MNEYFTIEYCNRNCMLVWNEEKQLNVYYIFAYDKENKQKYMLIVAKFDIFGNLVYADPDWKGL